MAKNRWIRRQNIVENRGSGELKLIVRQNQLTNITGNLLENHEGMGVLKMERKFRESSSSRDGDITASRPFARVPP